MTLVIGLCRRHFLVATALLDECEGLRSPCGHLMTRSVVGICHQHCLMATSVVCLRRQHCLMAMALLDECSGCLMATSVVCLHRQQFPKETPLLDKCEGLGLHSPCGSFVAMSVISLHRKH